MSWAEREEQEEQEERERARRIKEASRPTLDETYHPRTADALWAQVWLGNYTWERAAQLVAKIRGVPGH